MVSIGGLILFALLGGLVLALLAGLLWLGWKVLRAVLWLVGGLVRFAGRELRDTLHTVGALVTGAAMVPLVLVNLLILRFGASRHYAVAILDELQSVGAGVWRVALGNPLRLVGLGRAVDRIEGHFPDRIERAPRRSRGRRATFEGYDVVGTLPSGGSGAQLFVARPKPATLRRFQHAGRALPGEVVIKSFALQAGSTLPQIVRESRALEAASRLGLVCEHQLSNEHFYYVMPYVKGEDLDRVVRGLHARSGSAGPEGGLGPKELQLVLGYAIDLLETLERFHSEGLWHKDVKPANVIVAGGRAHLVDFGLVTPLASAMTLTTHGTEYYRDPEMVRLALQGVKVHEVDGCKFDVYSAGAVLYSMIENSFPAHGSLSKIEKRTPEALRWIVQRAMSELGQRYGSAREMRQDLAALMAAGDPFALKPADLPSFQGQRAEAPAEPASPARTPPVAGRVAPEGGFVATAPAAARHAPRRKHGFLPVALAAAGLFGMFTLATGALVVAGRSRQLAAHHRHAGPRLVSWDPRGLPGRVEAEESRWLTSRDQQVVALAEDVAHDLVAEEPLTPLAESTARSAEAILLEAMEGDASDAPVAGDGAPRSAGPSAQGAAGPAGRVLVLDDLASSVDRRALELLRTSLARRGFRVVGQESDGSDAAEAVELMAGARHAVGLGKLEEAETQAELQGFLDRTDGLDALILVSRGVGDEHLFRVLVRGKAAR
jgi:hypothetical protein